MIAPPRGNDPVTGTTLGASPTADPRDPSGGARNSIDNNPGQIWLMPVKMRQQFLASRGYKVTVDGKAGAQTLTAGKAFEKGIPADYWNKVWHQNHPAAIAGTSVPGAAPANTITPYVATTGTTPATTPTPTPAAGKIPGFGKFTLVDPTSYANAAMAAKYGPAQADLARQLTQAGVDQTGHQTDIQNWFAKMLSDQKQGGKDNVAALSGILSGADKANVGLVNALGGAANSASSGVASMGTAGRNALEQLAANQANFDDTQHTALARQGVDTANQEYNKGEATKKDLVAKMADMATQRGSDYVSTLSTAQQDRFKQALAVHDAKVSEAMLPGQLAGQTLDNTAKQTGIDLNNAKITAYNKANSGTQNWNLPQTKNDWNDAVKATVADKNGSLVTDPQQAWIQIQHAMARNGLSSNSSAVNVAKQALQDALSRSHARGLYKNWTWGPKGLVKLPPKKK